MFKVKDTLKIKILYSQANAFKIYCGNWQGHIFKFTAILEYQNFLVYSFSSPKPLG